MNSKSDTQPFQWSDSTALQFIGFYLAKREHPDFKEIDILSDFKDRIMNKASSANSVGRDWEIVSVISANGAVSKDWCVVNNFILGDKRYFGYSIHSVRRSDGVVFSVGDDVGWDLSQLPGNDKNLFRITSFQINKLLPAKDRIFCNNQNIDICYLKKAPIQEPKLHCGMCGGEKVFIRGKYPGDDKREVCPTCTTERLDQINEISSRFYGQTVKSEINNTGGE